MRGTELQLHPPSRQDRAQERQERPARSGFYDTVCDGRRRAVVNAARAARSLCQARRGEVATECGEKL